MIIFTLAMPFKTKKKKIAARSRKYSLAEAIVEKPSIKYSTASVGIGKVHLDKGKEVAIEKNYDYVRSDLKRIFLLSFAIAFIQLVLIFIL